jgi:hypothetical protein
MSSGDYIWFLDSNDILNPDFLSKKITHIENNLQKCAFFTYLTILKQKKGLLQ